LDSSRGVRTPRNEHHPGAHSNRQILMVQARDTGDNGVPFFDLIFDGIQEADVAGLVADLLACEKTANKGVANGYASLDSGGRVPFSQLPAGLLGRSNTRACGMRRRIHLRSRVVWERPASSIR
jgi:hypothetical protein